MNQPTGYIYVRRHAYYDQHNACKMGKTNNIPERDTVYATGEITRGYFELVFEVSINILGIVERLLQDKFSMLNIREDAGTEFYDKKIISLIEPFLVEHGIEYKNLTKQEISDLVRCNRVKTTLKKIKIRSLIHVLRNSKNDVHFTPRTDQSEIIEKALIYFNKYDKGLLVLMCGMGKTLISLWITQRLNSNTILIGVPNRLLLKQWDAVVHNLFKQINCLIVSDGVNVEDISMFLKNNKKQCVIITTYASSYKVHESVKNVNFTFNMKILDEVHHLTTTNIEENDRKTYVNILKIKSDKQISNTATLKILEDNEKYRDDDIIVSNDNIEYFGQIIEKKGLLYAINKNIVCDYVVQTIVTDEEKLEEQLSRFHITEDNDKRLFLSAYASLKSIYDRHSHHLLIYSNKNANSFKIVKYIKMLLDDNYFEIPGIYYSNYHSEMGSKHQKTILNSFEKSSCGIIVCVYCLGEGWDLPLLDGVVFAENMASYIRIIQCALRSGRINKKEMNKINKLILPILNRDEWSENNENTDLKRVKEIINQMSLEDETIVQKIKVFKIDIEKQNPKKPGGGGIDTVDEFGEYDEELTRKLRLRTTQRMSLGVTYEYVRKILNEKCIKSKDGYYKLCDIDKRIPREPQIHFKGKFTNWIEYLNIERRFYDLESCKNKVKEYLLQYPEIKRYYLDLSVVCSKLCILDELFPPFGLWVEYYNMKDLKDIIQIVNKKKRKGVVL